MRIKMTQLVAAAAALTMAAGSVSAAPFLDDFSTDTSGDYTKYVILDNGSIATSSNSTLVVSGGTASVTTTSHPGTEVEQQLYVRTGSSLAIGEELQVDVVSLSGVSRNVGLMVANASSLEQITALDTDTRADYLTISIGTISGAQNVSGFGDNGYLGASGFLPAVAVGDTLFIARTAATVYELGLYDASDSSTRIVAQTLGLSAGPVLGGGAADDSITNIDGSAVGFFADVRAAGSLSEFDNLRIVPEPGSLALLGLGGLLVARRRRD